MRYTIKWRDFDEATMKPLEVISFDATDNNTKWGDFALVPGGFPQKHLALKNDPNSEATVHDARSGDYTMLRACHIEYFVPPCTVGSSCIHILRNSWELPWPIEIVFLRNHFHKGGLNMTTRGAGYSCTGNASYSKDGFLYDISTCSLGRQQLTTENFRVERGEKIIVEALYTQDQLPHYGVMAMSFVYAHIPRTQGWYV